MTGWKESKPDRHGPLYCPSLQRRPEIFGLKMFFFLKARPDTTAMMILPV